MGEIMVFVMGVMFGLVVFMLAVMIIALLDVILLDGRLRQSWFKFLDRRFPK